MASLPSKTEIAPERPSPFLDPAVAQRRQKRWFIGLGLGSLVIASVVLISRPFGSGQDGVVAATIILAGLTGILAVVSNYQGERQGQVTWQIHAWERRRTEERDAREAWEKSRLAKKRDSEALERELIGAYGPEYPAKMRSAKPTLHDVRRLAARAGFDEAAGDIMARACALSRSFFDAASRAVQREAEGRLEEMNALDEAHRREHEEDRRLDEYIEARAMEPPDPDEMEYRAEQRQEEVEQTIREYLHGASALGWKPPSPFAEGW